MPKCHVRSDIVYNLELKWIRGAAKLKKNLKSTNGLE